jgi:hypothetical protein
VVSLSDPRYIHARAKIIDASKSVARLFEMVRHKLVQGHFGVYYSHTSNLCAMNLIDLLAEPGVPELFHIMISVLSTVSRRWTLTMGVINMIWTTVKLRHLDRYLQASTVQQMKLNPMESWGSRRRQLLETCIYPNYAAIGDRGRDFVEMGELLQEYAGLQIGKDANTTDQMYEID